MVRRRAQPRDTLNIDNIRANKAAVNIAYPERKAQHRGRHRRCQGEPDDLLARRHLPRRRLYDLVRQHGRAPRLDRVIRTR